jgi:hypothetical protein
LSFSLRYVVRIRTDLVQSSFERILDLRSQTHTPIFRSKAAEMVQLIEAELKVDHNSVINLGDYGNRALLDVLGLAMMRYDFQTLQHPNNEFRNQFRKIALESNRTFKWMQLISHYFDLRPLLLAFSLIPGRRCR